MGQHRAGLALTQGSAVGGLARTADFWC